MKIRKVIVTGANGFVGSALCKALSSQGVKVIAVVRDEKSNISSIADIENLSIVYCDMTMFKELSQKIEGRDIDVFYHLAWSGTSGPLRGSFEVQMHNISSTCEAVNACSELRCKKFLFASSVMEYEVHALMKTDFTPGINTIYSSAKVAAAYMARAIAGKCGVEFVRAVISNIYGPGEVSSRLINLSIRKMLNKEKCAYSSGEQMYDFIYIDDAVDALIAIGKYGLCNKTYYIGSLTPRKLKEFLYEMRDQIDENIDINLGEIPFNGITLKYNEFDIFAVKKDTGFVPKISFAQGIKNTVKWIMENK